MTLHEKLEAQFQLTNPTISEIETLEMFIMEYQNLRHYVEKRYSGGVPDSPNNFEQKLITYQENLYSRPDPPTEIKILTYEWQSPRYFIVPGYINKKEEIQNFLPQIIAINIKRRLFVDGDFTHPNKCLPQIKWLHINDEILGWLFNQKWNDRQWEDIVIALKATSTNKPFQALVNGLSDVRADILKFSNETFEEDRNNWEEKYAFSFPINHYDLDQITVDLENNKLSEKEDKIAKIREISQDQVLALREFLHTEYQPLRTDGELDETKYISGLLREFPVKDEHGISSVDRLDAYLKLVVAATLRDRYDKLIRLDLEVFDAGKCEKDDLLLAALTLSHLKLIENENKAIRFVAEHFKVRVGQGVNRKIGFIKPATLTKLRSQWEKGSSIPSAWRLLKNKIDNYFSK